MTCKPVHDNTRSSLACGIVGHNCHQPAMHSADTGDDATTRHILTLCIEWGRGGAFYGVGGRAFTTLPGPCVCRCQWPWRRRAARLVSAVELPSWSPLLLARPCPLRQGMQALVRAGSRDGKVRTVQPLAGQPRQLQGCNNTHSPSKFTVCSPYGPLPASCSSGAITLTPHQNSQCAQLTVQPLSRQLRQLQKWRPRVQQQLDSLPAVDLFWGQTRHSIQAQNGASVASWEGRWPARSPAAA